MYTVALVGSLGFDFDAGVGGGGKDELKPRLEKRSWWPFQTRTTVRKHIIFFFLGALAKYSAASMILNASERAARCCCCLLESQTGS